MKQAFLPTCLLLLAALSCDSQENETTTTQPENYYSIGLAGNAADVQTATQGGIVLMGGSTDVDQAMQWMLARSGGGDVVILRATGSTGYNQYLFELASVNSVETLLIDSKTKAQQPAVGKRIREAEALFIAGGDQANYVNFWSNTEVSAAINYLINEKKVPVGGTSAGCAVLSRWIFDARQGSVISTEALANPYNTLVSVSESFIQAPFLENTLADQHYAQREREGRQVVFLARMKKDLGVAQPKGIGVDEKTAVCIDHEGNATVFGSSKAYFLQATSIPETCSNNQPLTWKADGNAIGVHVFQGSSAGTTAFNLSTWPAATIFWSVENGVLKKN
jgi:cyanophycinase